MDNQEQATQTNNKAEELKTKLAEKGIKAGNFYGKGGVTGLKFSLVEIEKLLAMLAQ